jgi:HlyD family secretion protein
MRTLPLLSIAAALLSGCGAPNTKTTIAASEPQAVAVSVISVAAEPFQATVPVTGTLVSTVSVDVKAETVGRIVKFDKEEGSAVAAGEAVVWLNDENYQLALRQSRTVVEVAKATCDRAKLLEAHSRSELERAENLLKSGGITDKDLKAARLAEQDAQAQVAVAEAECEQARATLEVAQKHVRDAVIHAPVNGVIQRKFVNPGAYVEASTALFSVVDNRRLEMISQVASADLAGIHEGQRVAFSVNTYPGEKFEGRVIEIVPALETDTRSAKVRIRVESAGRLKAGMFAEGEVMTGLTAQAMVIPAAAVYRDDRSAKSSYVFVVENGKAARRQVRIGRERQGKLEILEGLTAGDALIAEQSIEIAQGVRIKARS